MAGAAGGTLKIWDLELQKVVRTLTGHRANCISVDFHPYGEYFASGSLDTNLKIWDIRRRGCVHTYKGHTGGVRCVKFSPDGRWLVSGGQDNSVKVRGPLCLGSCSFYDLVPVSQWHFTCCFFFPLPGSAVPYNM